MQYFVDLIFFETQHYLDLLLFDPKFMLDLKLFGHTFCWGPIIILGPKNVSDLKLFRSQTVFERALLVMNVVQSGFPVGSFPFILQNVGTH